MFLPIISITAYSYFYNSVILPYLMGKPLPNNHNLNGILFIGATFLSIGVSFISLYILTFFYNDFIFNKVDFLVYFIFSYSFSGIISFLAFKKFFVQSILNYIKFFITVSSANVIAYIIMFRTFIGTFLIVISFIIDFFLLLPLLTSKH